MIALPENAIEPKNASARPVHGGEFFEAALSPGSAAMVEDRMRPRSPSEPGGLPVAARIARGDVALDARVAEPPDELPGAEVLVAVVDDLHPMPARDEAFDRRRLHRRLDVD